MPSGRFCYLCGDSENELVEGLCRVCFAKERQEIFFPDKFVSTICKVCGSYKCGVWKSGAEPFENVVKAVALREAKPYVDKSKTQISGIRIIDTLESGKSIDASLEIELLFSHANFSRTNFFKTSLSLKKVLCPACSKRSGGYYEALLQIRTDSPNRLLMDAHKYIEDLYKKDRMAYISEESDVKGGVDLKIGSSRVAKNLAGHLKKIWNADVKESMTLMGRRDGKNVYRKTILIRV